jgi:hypothetical protein
LGPEEHDELLAARDPRRQALERARVAPLERLATTPGGAASAARYEPAAAARARSLTLMYLSTDVLDKVVTFLDSDDELAASLACRRLRE